MTLTVCISEERIDKKTLKRYLDKLEEKGHLERRKIEVEFGESRETVFVLLVVNYHKPV